MKQRQASADNQGQRERILEQSAELFWERGFHGSSMNDVADAVGLRKPSLYHYITNKEDLLFELSAASLEHIAAAADSVADSEPVSRLRALMTAHVEALLSDQAMHATALVELRALPPEQRKKIVRMRDSYAASFDAAVRDVQKVSDIWVGLDPELVTFGLLGMLNWVVFWFKPSGKYSSSKVAETLVTMALGDVEREPQRPKAARGARNAR